MGAGSFFKTVGKVAFPFLSVAAQAGGPFTAMAANAVGKVLGITGDSTTDQIETAMASAAMNPDQMIALKKVEEDFQAQMKQLDITLEQIAAGDRDSARKREMAVRDRTPKILAFVIVFSFVATVIYVLSGHAKVETVLAGTLIGYISAKAELVLAYYFGSSAGSDRKTELLAQAPAVTK